MLTVSPVSDILSFEEFFWLVLIELRHWFDHLDVDFEELDDQALVNDLV